MCWERAKVWGLGGAELGAVEPVQWEQLGLFNKYLLSIYYIHILDTVKNREK